MKNRSSKNAAQSRLRRRASRLGCEPLELRALMATSALDPSFGAGGIVQQASGGGALAVLSDGKILEVSRGDVRTTVLVVRRFNADGSPDATFGTNGSADINLPSQVSLPGDLLSLDAGTPRDIVIGPDGSINLSSTIYVQPGNFGQPYRVGLVARLTASGQPDPGFGTDGVTVLDSTRNNALSVAVQADGKLVVSGTEGGVLFVDRYTTAGVLDTTFHGTGQLLVDSTQDGGYYLGDNYNYPGAVQVGTDGQIYVATAAFPVNYTAASSLPIVLLKVGADGTLDSTFGAGGVEVIAPAGQRFADVAMAIDGAGRIVVAGYSQVVVNYAYLLADTGVLMRRLADGSPDPTFGADGSTTMLLNRIQVSSLAIGTDGTITVGGGALSGEVSNINDVPNMVGLAQFGPDGTPNLGFGTRGRYTVPLGSPASPVSAGFTDLALTPSNDILVLGGRSNPAPVALLAKVLPVAVTEVAGDSDDDGKADVAAYLTGPAVYATRPSGGGADLLRPFGQPGTGNTIPAPGDYDGSGHTETAVYLPAVGAFFYHALAGYGDTRVDFGSAGAGNSIPASADYDGDGITDLAVYEPQYAGFAIRPSDGAAPYFVQFGVTGKDNAIPAPGDYDGDGKADLAVYLPQYGILAYRPSSGGADVLTSFGAAGARASIPAPGDYDGDGKTDLAVYLPQYAVYAYRPSSGGADVLASFGVAGDGATIPAPGDYDGDGKTDLAVYIPRDALFGYRPSSAVASGGDVLTSFGVAGVGATVPTASIPYAQPAAVSGMALASSAGSGDVPIALTDDVLAELAGLSPGKKHA